MSEGPPYSDERSAKPPALAGASQASAGTPPLQGSGGPEARSPAEGQGSDGRGRSAHDVFVSHTSGHQDKLVTDAIVSRLEQAGIRCWVAPRDIMPGMVYAEAIIEAIAASRLMVVVLSREANESRHVYREVERAVANDVVIIPFRIESVELSKAMAYFLSAEHWLDAMTPPIEAHIARLVDVAGALLQKTGPVRQSPAHAPPPPPPRRGRWPGRRHWLVTTLILAAVGLAAALVLTLLPRGTAPPRQVPLSQLKVGDCLQTPSTYEQSSPGRKNFWANSNIPWPAQMPVVSCGQPHSGEVFFAGNGWPANKAYPGDKAIYNDSDALCKKSFKAYVGIPVAESFLGYTWVSPVQDQWVTDGYRHLACVAYDPDGNNSQQSVRGSRR
jgi:hypothetical protein